MSKKFRTLELSKITIAKLNDDQLGAVKGGNGTALSKDPEIICRDKGSTIVCTGTTIVETGA
ncbi:class I lanthipeptide [Flavobacterium sp. JP2137]|uniref:class I lanthipeptide n=1 Tax=Flavobacterium sp. JP2137 TaxID=3414510 RepID=UPI003D2FBFDE